MINQQNVKIGGTVNLIVGHADSQVEVSLS